MENKIDFIGQGSYSCVFRPAIKCDHTIDPNNPNDKYFVSKISKKDKYIDNEYHISSLLQQIPHYYNYFSPILENCDADLYKLGTATAASVEFQKCDLFHKDGGYGDEDGDEDGGEGADADDEQEESNHAPNGDYIYNKIRYVGHSDLYGYLEDLSSEPEAKSSAAWLDAFEYLAHSISLLREKGVVHYDFKGNNVMVHDKHHSPIIIDFGLSIDINQIIGAGTGADAGVEDRLKRAFYVYSTDYEVWCPEIVFICYFTQERASKGTALFDPITAEDIEFVCSDFMKNNGIFGERYFRMDDQARENYRVSMRDFFSEFLGKPATEAIIEITRTYYKTWDMYSLVVCFQGAIEMPAEFRKYAAASPKFRV